MEEDMTNDANQNSESPFFEVKKQRYIEGRKPNEYDTLLSS